ncbi:putative phage tail protein [Streptomyces chartreusis]|uniref:putative phage tail protein n=1 Tax=Streptomyces chartreusis TaxID=1969 RepID=UPI00369A1132
MLTIHHLSVDFEVGGDDTAVFARLFSEHIKEWARRQENERARSRLLAGEAAMAGEDSGHDPASGHAPAPGCCGGA